jgi:magnesium-transporting ATPase (P-type)
MSPLQALWLNMVTSSPPAIGLGMEKADYDVMDNPPRAASELFSLEVVLDMLMYGFIAGTIALVSFVFVVYVYGASTIAIAGGIPHGCNKLTYVSITGAPGEIPVTDPDNACYYVYRARGTVFVLLSFLVLLHAINCKHRTRSLFKMNLRDNFTLFWIGALPRLHQITFCALNSDVIISAA